MLRSIQRFADSHHHAVHHAGRGDDIHARLGIRDGLPLQVFQGGVIVTVTARIQDAAMAVGGVFAKAGVGNDQELRIFGANGANGALYQPLRRPGGGAGGILAMIFNDAEQQHPGDAPRRGLRAELQRRVDAVAENAGHGGDFRTDAIAFHQKDRQDEIRRTQMMLTQHPAHGRVTPQAAGLVAGRQIEQVHATGSRPCAQAISAANMPATLASGAIQGAGRPTVLTAAAVRGLMAIMGVFFSQR